MAQLKISADSVIDFLDQVRALVLDITETVRIGYDGYGETVMYQVDSIVKAIDVYKVESCTPVTPLKKKQYLKDYQKLDMDNISEENAAAANTTIYKSQLYLFLKRQVNGMDLTGVKNEDLHTYIEGAVNGTKYERLMYSKEWMYASMHVVDDIAEDIKEHRARNIQTSLFK